VAVAVPAQAIADAKAADGELWPVLLAIAGPESSWRADAIGDNGTSFGYLQMHTPGGLGDGHSIAELLDGVTNLRLGAQYIRQRLANGASLYDALSPWSARPQAWALLQRMENEGIEGEGAIDDFTDGQSANAGGGGVVLLLAIAIIAVIIWR